MAVAKMRYGIDLGTTNSAICRMENGDPKIIKTDTQKDTLPSCISCTKRGIKAGDRAYNDLRMDKARATKSWSQDKENVFIEFKRTMGLDTCYESSAIGKSFSSEELSAEVLKTLKSFVTTDEVKAAVITVPAKFKADQIAATKRAAQMAGIETCELLQEPIAASMAYGLSSEKKEGRWLVFDFGGGTFDAALLHVEDGIMRVQDTEGDNYLGGKNLDYAIVDEVILPYLEENYAVDEILADEYRKEILRDAVKFYAEQAKNALSFNKRTDIISQLDEFGDDDEGESLELDLEVTTEDIEPALKPYFQKAIDIVQNLLRRNNLKGSDLDSLILVGGPTFSPILRDMLRQQVTPNVDTSIDPMTAVARGAALFASGKDYEVTQMQAGVVALHVEYESNTVEETQFVTVALSDENGKRQGRVFVDLTRGDKGWTSGKVEVTEAGEVFECQLKSGTANAFEVAAYDGAGNRLPCFPDTINIMQGFVVGNAVLPYHVGIEAEDERERHVFVPLKGLEKNKPLPAIGVREALKTPKALRPGMSGDTFRIPVYQGEHNAEGTSAIYNDHVFDVVISGDDVPEFIPANSEIGVALKIDASQMMKMEVTFKSCGEVVEKDVEVSKRSAVSEYELENRLEEATDKLEELRSGGSVGGSELREADAILSDVQRRFDGEKSSEDGKMHLLADIRRAFLEMEHVENRHAWDSVEAELRETFSRLERADRELGNKRSSDVEAMRTQVDAVIRRRDEKIGREVLKSIEALHFDITKVFQLMGFIDAVSGPNFNASDWKNPSLARKLLNEGREVMMSNPELGRLAYIVSQLVPLLVRSEKLDGDLIKL